ncbi:hypothetical protein LTR02_006467 [Friedmanniomyces endolithicus]|nr:hypothetical protein LTR38_011697 [Friedmanniomyces endolithicus]KAK0794866.1 hypothetical protein LTR75_010708 [Friedmanniomyces endolithicus]KAK0800057.1 hypothetical protein LTR59_005854 [Friedmanniomyces endolithicus]KAK0832487.1 hypothetical protein LTR03_015199 [Friedmanniomyces endolithicus]KAK0859907.1 hypothetical protein LTS02_008870 [Friedmanniomyces endolithicus]
MGSDARVALFAPSPLAPYVSLPSIYGGSTGYYSPTTRSDASTWGSTAVPNYTPAAIKPLTTYKDMPRTPVTLLPGVAPAPSTVAPAQPLGLLGTTSGSRPYWSPVASASSSTTSTSPLYSSGSSAAQGLIHGPPLGVAVGVPLGVCALFGLLFALWWTRRRDQGRRKPHLKQQVQSRSKDITWALGPIHLTAPVTMISALLAGVVFAVGHHLFYHGLAGHAVSDHYGKGFGSSVSAQEINIAIGTAFAFLVRACLVLAVSTAYIQAFWRAAKARQSEMNLTVAQLDAAFSALTNLLAFAKGPLWLRNPNTYFYSPLKLWLAYGLAIAFATVAVLVGLAYMYIDEASYSNSFSTIMRTSRGAELSIDIAHEDASGANPLPSEMAGATVRFQDGKAGGERSSEQGWNDRIPAGGQTKSSAQDALLEGEGRDHGARHAAETT